MADKKYAGLTQLGAKTAPPASPEDAILERVPNPHREDYLVRFVQPEFTSLCPITGQPDFAHLVIDYVPNRWLVESKSLTRPGSEALTKRNPGAKIFFIK